MNKNILGVTTLVVLGAVVSVGYYFGFSGDNVSANPDYICTKSVTNQPCVVADDDWSEWDTNWKRTWVWKMATQFRYYATRTGCESWYTKTDWGGYNSWASWRKTADFVSSSSTCTIIQEDTVPPVWEINNN